MDTTCDPAVLKAMAQRAIRFFPVLKDIKIIRTYAGLRPYTPDHMPIISNTRIPGFYIATGHEGNGIGLSLITGKLIMQMICRLKPDISVEPLRFDRFNEHPTRINREE
jgi:sarcosine oxidase subunit beta